MHDLHSVSGQSCRSLSIECFNSLEYFYSILSLLVIFNLMQNSYESYFMQSTDVLNQTTLHKKGYLAFVIIRSLYIEIAIRKYHGSMKQTNELLNE